MPAHVSVHPSTEAGQLHWSHSGEELFYVRGTNRMTAAEVTAGETFFAGAQMELFSTARYADAPNHRSYDVSPDDQHFMTVRRQAEGSANRLTVVENFFAELRRLVND